MKQRKELLVLRGTLILAALLFQPLLEVPCSSPPLPLQCLWHLRAEFRGQLLSSGSSGMVSSPLTTYGTGRTGCGSDL